nr:hypothetical protein [Tanacetum cinerariifolium]
MTPSTLATITTISHAPIPPTTIPSKVLQNLPTFDSVFHFEDRLKLLEANFSKYIQTNLFAEAVSNIPCIVYQYMNQQMNEAVRVAVQIQTDRLCDSYQRENDEFLRTINENMKRIIKEQVKAEVLTKSSYSSRTSYAIATDLSEMELKKILIEKMEGNKSIQHSDEQRNLYKALVKAYEADKIIHDTYGETVTLKRRRDDESNKDEGPSVGSDRGLRDEEKVRSLNQLALYYKLQPGVAPLQTSTPIMTPSTLATITTISHAPIPPTTIPSEVLQNLPTFDSVFHFEDRLKFLEANFSKYIQTNLFAEAVSNIPCIVYQYMNQQMNEAVRVAVQIQTDRLCDSYQRENDEFLRTINENMKRIIKEQVKAEVLTRSSHSSRTSYAIATDLSEMELKKILIEKMEGNKSIQHSDEQRNLYKALVEAYEADKIIHDTYGETVTLKRRRDDESNKDEGPSVGSDQGLRDEEKVSANESAFVEEPVQTTCQMDEPSYPMFETGAGDQPIVQSSQHSDWFS